MIDNLRAFGKQKTELIIKIKFISSIDNTDKHVLYTKSEDIVISNDTDEIIQENFNIPLNRYHLDLEHSVKGSSFVFDQIEEHYKIRFDYKISLRHSRSYLDSSKWIKNKQATIYPKNNY